MDEMMELGGIREEGGKGERKEIYVELADKRS